MARICMVAFTHYSTDTRIRREAESLIDRGDSVDMISLSETGAGGSSRLEGVEVFHIPTGRYRGSSVVMYLLTYFSFFVVASLLLAYLQTRRGYHVIQVHTMPDFMVFVGIVPKLLGAKIVLDVHDLMPELYQSKYRLKRTHWLVRFITWVERRSIAFADRAIAVHQPHLDTLVEHGNPAGKFTVLLNVPDPKIFDGPNPAPPEHRGFKLLYHGTVARRHGLDIALRAVALVKEEIKGIELRIVGSGDDFARLIDMARHLNIADSVRFDQGLVPIAQLVPVILETDIGVVPILCDEFTRHMLPGKLLEYVALDRPVICSRTETIQAYFDDSMVQYFEPGNAAQLADQIRLLYRDPGKRARLIANASRFNREYNWRQQKQLYYRLIDDLAGQTMHLQGKGRAPDRQTPAWKP